ncbi:hypothetical protein [Spirosoma panaciterrae]|uniref:hypothetical protein n=1 Tax=Spirosoma panaciterrae TaxID=496058 RepID=UPI0003AAD6A9|nr:hypothetical protein [Spirosoma panaciterrae]
MKKHLHSEYSFEVWINEASDNLGDETGSFDDNWIVSASDLFSQMNLPTNDPMGSYEEVA